MLASLVLASLLSDHPKRVIVEFRGVQSVAARRETLRRFHRDVESIGRSVAAARLADSAPAPSIRHEYLATFFGAAIDVDGNDVDALRTLPYVRAVYQDREVHALAIAGPNATLLSNGGARVNALNLPTKGEGIRVAVIDTGIDYTHPALGGGFGPGFKVAGGYDFVNDDADPMDDNGHGTHCAGIIAAESDVLLGVAPHVTLYAFKVLDRNGSGSFSDVIAGIEAAADPNHDGDTSDHVDVASMSLGGTGSSDDPQSRAVDAAVAAGVVICVAAGNSGSFAVIGSPGTARNAITVGAINDSGAMASFSSRGPTPGNLLFKPDVVAPGSNIISTYLGGGTASLSGTSMATPHVAGAAALLLSLHHNWTPADVKRALASSATSIVGTPFDRGAGRVDAQLASQATIFASQSGLSFGIDANASGSFDQTRTITVTNRGALAVTLDATSTAFSAANVTISPSSVVLDPGQSRSFDVRVTIDNVAAGFPSNKTVSGGVIFAGVGQSMTIPWAVARSARMTINAHVLSGATFAYTSDSPTATIAFPYDDEHAEAFVEPGKTWDLFVIAGDVNADGAFGRQRFIASPNHAVNADETFAFGADDAPYLVTLDTRDETGTRLAALPKIPSHRRHNLILHMQWDATLQRSSDLIIGSNDSFYVSALPNVHLIPYELYVDADNLRFYSVKHDEVTNVSGPVTQSMTIGSFSHARWKWVPQGSDRTFTGCAGSLHRNETDAAPYITSCVTRNITGDLTIDSYVAGETGSELLLPVVSLASQSLQLNGIRAGENGVTVVSTDSKPSPNAFRMASGDEASVGIGPLFPLAFVDATLETTKRGVAGAFGELHDAPGAHWSMLNAAGTEVSSGSGSSIPASKAGICAGCRIVAQLLPMRAAGQLSEGDLELRAVEGSDRIPPTLTSLRLLDASGQVADRVKNGESATLRFSAADYSATSTELLKAEATSISYRLHGTAEWRKLDPSVESSETGSNASFGRRLAGSQYRVDLSPATANPNVLIDLRIEVEDVAGNHMTWTQSPAFAVGDVTTPPRHRAIR